MGAEPLLALKTLTSTVSLSKPLWTSYKSPSFTGRDDLTL